MLRFGEAKNQVGNFHDREVLHSEASSCRRSKVRGDEICPTGRAFDVVSTGDHGIREMTNKIEEQDFGVCMGDSDCPSVGS